MKSKTTTQLRLDAIGKHYGFNLSELARFLDMPYATLSRLYHGHNAEPRIIRYRDAIEREYNTVIDAEKLGV